MEVYAFSSKLAKEIGVVEATFLQLLYQVIRENEKLCIIEDGVFWFPCAIKEWNQYIDLWSYRQIDRIAHNCLLKHVLYLRHYDVDEKRRRGWYGISKKVIPLLKQVNDAIGE